MGRELAKRHQIQHLLIRMLIQHMLRCQRQNCSLDEFLCLYGRGAFSNLMREYVDTLFLMP